MDLLTEKFQAQYKSYTDLALRESAGEEFVQEFPSFKPIGIIKTLDNGDILALEFPSRKILGMYIKSNDHTVQWNPYKVIGRGNQVAKFIYVK